MLARPLDDLVTCLPSPPPRAPALQTPARIRLDRVFGGMTFDRDHPSVGLGREPVAGLDLVRAGPDRPGQERRQLFVVGRDIAGEVESGSRSRPARGGSCRVERGARRRRPSFLVERDEPARGDARVAVFLAAFEDVAGAHAGELPDRQGERICRVILAGRGAEGIVEESQPPRDDRDDLVLLAAGLAARSAPGPSRSGR